MNRITEIDISNRNLDLRFLFLTNDIKEANKLRRIFLNEIETFAIEYVSFYENISSRYDEIIALRLAQLVIDHNKIDFTLEKLEGNLEKEGPSIVKSSDIKGIPFTYETPILELASNEKISCFMIAKKGRSKTHVKWRPVANVSFTQEEKGFRFYIRLLGMLEPETLIRKAVELL